MTRWAMAALGVALIAWGATGPRMCLETVGAADDVFCACPRFTPRPSRRKAKVGT